LDIIDYCILQAQNVDKEDDPSADWHTAISKCYYTRFGSSSGLGTISIQNYDGINKYVSLCLNLGDTIIEDTDNYDGYWNGAVDNCIQGLFEPLKSQSVETAAVILASVIPEPTSASVPATWTQADFQFYFETCFRISDAVYGAAASSSEQDTNWDALVRMCIGKTICRDGSSI